MTFPVNPQSVIHVRQLRVRIHIINCDFSCGKWQEELRVDRSSWTAAQACEAEVRRDGL